jgi:mRNA interferase YafQ
MEIKTTGKFEKDYKRIISQSKDLWRLKAVMSKLAGEKPLDSRHQDHKLKGNYAGHRECHITSDWLLIYKIIPSDGIIIFVRTGTHSELFG